MFNLYGRSHVLALYHSHCFKKNPTQEAACRGECCCPLKRIVFNTVQSGVCYFILELCNAFEILSSGNDEAQHDLILNLILGVTSSSEESCKPLLNDLLSIDMNCKIVVWSTVKSSLIKIDLYIAE